MQIFWLLTKNVSSKFLSSYIHTCVIWNSLSVFIEHSRWIFQEYHGYISILDEFMTELMWFVNESFLQSDLFQWISWFTKPVRMILLLNQMVLKFNSLKGRFSVNNSLLLVCSSHKSVKWIQKTFKIAQDSYEPLLWSFYAAFESFLMLDSPSVHALSLFYLNTF